MKRALIITALCLLPLFGSNPAQGFSLDSPLGPRVLGGSLAQQQAVREVIVSCRITYGSIVERIGPVTVAIVDDIPGQHFRVAATSPPNLILVKGTYDNLRPGDKRVRWNEAEVSPIFRDVICHEWGHQVWDALPSEWQKRWNLTHFHLRSWPIPEEAFAENFRLTMFPTELLWRTTTVSSYPMLSREDMQTWVEKAMQLPYSRTYVRTEFRAHFPLLRW